MKRMKKTGIMLTLIMIMTISVPVVASAASVPKSLEELERDVAHQTVVGSGNEMDISIPVQGYIVAEKSEEKPQDTDNTNNIKKSGITPRTGDSANMETHLILLLSSLLMLLLLAVRKEREEVPQEP